ncbi:Kinesin-like protein 6 [Penicillium rolfsii]|nr:Kinesin-like protein 6 [Penicillium rolfsii]
MASSDGASSITVAVRVRPFTIREAAQLSRTDDAPLFLGDGSLAGVPTPKLNQKGLRSIVKVIDDRCLVFDPPEDNPVQKFSRSVVPQGKRVKDQTFAFDRIFDQNASQGEVYENTTRGLLDSVLDGYNATVFAYGATGCGKTHTITGTAQQPGIIFLTMQELFERIDERSSEKSTEISLSYLEIYNETIRDLLVPGTPKGGLMLREDVNQSVSVAGLSSHRPQNVEQVMDMIVRGNECRTMSPTEANATSSRSHAVLQINIAQKDRNAGQNEPHTMATLSIIDLAGSERASATKNRGDRLFEGANINKSLLALGSCINALCDPRKRNHIPYRNSKLTRLLKFALGGNCKTVMIVCVSPSSQHFDETQNTLRYANRAKNIQTKITRNVFNVNRHVKDFLVKIDEQMNLINELKAQAKDSENVAFAKFQKQTEKKDLVVREGVARIRSAYEHSLPERQEKTNNMLKLRQISRRIGILSSWIAAFDTVCESHENQEGLSNLHAVRKTAQGILLELESSRHHYNQRLSKSTWDRAMVSAVENATKQLREFDISDASDYANLDREAELLRSNAECEALSAVVDQDKAGEAAAVQLLLQAQFEMMASIENIMQLNATEALQKGRLILMKMLEGCTDAVTNLVKPDASLPTIPNNFNLQSPTKAASPPKPRKRFSLAGMPAPRLSLVPSVQLAPAAPTSPVKSSPRRRKVVAGRKAVNFTPKRTQAKASKRSVRWKDDEEDGPLIEFQKTPQKPAAESPDDAGSEAGAEPSEPTLPRGVSPIPRNIPRKVSPSYSISPAPGPAEPTLNVPKNGNRFKAGFLSKKAGSSPLGPPPSTSLPISDNEISPLRDIDGSSFLNRASSEKPSRIAVRSPSGNFSSSPVSDSKDNWKTDKEEAMKINSAMRRISSSHVGAISGGNSLRIHRRRSPTSATYSSSPSDGTMFTASQARRMVKSEREGEAKPSVLSPHALPVMKNTARRTTLGGDIRPRHASLSSRDALRLSAIAAPTVNHLPDSTSSGLR